MPLTLAAFAVISASALESGGPIELVFLFPEEPVYYDLTQDMTTRRESDGRIVSVDQSFTNRVRSERVSTRESGAIVLANTTESIRMRMSGPGIDVTYDSEAPDGEHDLSNPTIASVAAMKGMQVRLLIEPNGAIAEVVNIEEIQDRVFDMQDPAMMAGAAAMLNEETIIAMNEANYRLLPDGPVAVGSSWQHIFATPFPLGAVNMTMDLTLKEIIDRDGRPLARISIDGSIELDVGEGTALRLEHRATDLSGGFLFSIDEGLVETMNLRTDMGIEFYDPFSDAMVLSMGVKQNIRMDRVPAGASGTPKPGKTAEHPKP